MRRPPHKALWLGTVVAAAALLAGCEFSCSIGTGDKIDPAKAEEEISGGLEDTYGEPPKALSCPDDVEPVDGETFVCAGEAPDGQPFEIEVTMTDDEGGIRYPTQVQFTGPPPAGDPQ